MRRALQVNPGVVRALGRIVGFEIFVQWFANGNPASVAFADVLAPFGPAVELQEEAGFRVRYGPNEDCYVYARRDAHGQVARITVKRPCSDPALWDGIVKVMRLGHSVCYWPGEACATSDSQVLDHLPRDMAGGLPRTTVVEDGPALMRLVKAS